MFPVIQGLSKALNISISPFNLQTLEGFPYNTWTAQNEIYTDYENWYRGVPLSEKITDPNTNKQVDKYPIKINPLKGTAETHTAVLFGTAVESLHFGTIPVRFKADSDKEQEELAKKIQDALLNVFEENNGGALFIQNGITSQYMGGCIFWVSWRPDLNKLQISAPSPREVVIIPNGTDYWTSREAWLVREITKLDALGFGFQDADFINHQQFYYIEHWTADTYSVQINDKYITLGETLMRNVPNPFGIVPCVYIPHIRDRGFYGASIVTESVKGIIREMNLRWADIGDAVSEDSHGILAARNIRSSIKTLKVAADGRPIIDLGSRTGIGSSEGDPDLFAVTTNSASDPMMKLADSLYDLYRVEAKHPAVADGKDEGSQRSSLTLTTRMWPLVSHAELERIFWTVGLKTLAKMLLQMMEIKGLYEITKEALDVRLIIEWTTMLPRDREALVNEAAVRASNKLGSQYHLIEMLGDVPDVQEELDRIQEEADAAMERTIKLAQATKPEPGGDSAGDKKPPAKPGDKGKISSGQVKKTD